MPYLGDLSAETIAVNQAQATKFCLQMTTFIRHWSLSVSVYTRYYCVTTDQLIISWFKMYSDLNCTFLGRLVVFSCQLFRRCSRFHLDNRALHNFLIGIVVTESQSQNLSASQYFTNYIKNKLHFALQKSNLSRW